MNILNCSENCEKLNSALQTALGRHLFIFCNYEETCFPVFGDDAVFFMNVQKLYKLLIDASVINYFGGTLRKYRESVKYDKRKIDEISDIVSSLRTYLDHNLSDKSANTDDLLTVKKWVSVSLNKTISSEDKLFFDRLEEYKALNRVLMNYADDVERILKDIIEAIGKMAQDKKETLKSDWEKMIIKLYERDNSKKIIEGYLKNAFKLSTNGNNFDISPNDLGFFIKQMMHRNDDETINTMQLLIRERGARLPKESIRLINEKIEESKANKKKVIEEIALKIGCTGSDVEGDDKCYLRYYIKTLPERITDKIANGGLNNLSLLPQDIVADIVYSDFSL